MSNHYHAINREQRERFSLSYAHVLIVSAIVGTVGAVMLLVSPVVAWLMVAAGWVGLYLSMYMYDNR